MNDTTSPAVRGYRPEDWPEWLRMRSTLWPGDEANHEAEMREWLDAPDRTVLFHPRPGGGLGGFIELAERSYADGCLTSPVGYVEGWYVDPDLRWRGAGRALMEGAERWGRSRGYSELASDTELENRGSQEAHQRLGFTEVGRSVNFRREL